MQDADLPPPQMLCAWGLADARVSLLGSGLINRTWLVEAGGDRFVMQQLNPIFAAAVNDDIRVVTGHLRSKGLIAPELLPAEDGSYWQLHEGGIYRLMTWVAGASHERLTSVLQAQEAGALLARFHRALDDCRHEFRSARAGVHDTPRHLANLRRALAEHGGHPQYAVVRPLAEEILALAAALEPLPALPDRLVHGDPKINNILFDPVSDRALCLIDLDTLGRMPLPLELGDAFRSWCNPRGEDDQRTAFSLEFFRAAVEGYAPGVAGWITPAECQAIVPATLTIQVELAARFCADALNESYFGWDASRYPSRSAHNQLRAAGQLSAARSLLGMRGAAEEVVRRAFG
ncbi:MAG: aminoglycoside phosphotransferase family protein [Gammaproteobacteria bacterium]